MTMEPVAKRKRRSFGPRSRLLLLLSAALVLTALALLLLHLSKEPHAAAPQPASTARTLFSHAPEDVKAITVQRPNEAPWAVTEDEASRLFVLTGEDSYTLSEQETAKLRDAAHDMTCEAVLAQNRAEYAGHLADFGLDAPGRVASITFSDGSTVTLRVGSATAHNAAWYYTTIDGDDCLYALGTGFVDALFVSRESLVDVVQPVLHRARIDRITLTRGDGSIQAEWTLQGSIEAGDASDRWRITQPFAYPADAQSMSSILTNAANLRLGAYVAPATPDNLTRYGFDTPRMTIEIHMAPGTIGTTDMDGAFTAEDWPESTCTFVIGGQRSDMVDYVLHENSIYVSSHFTMGVFLSVDPRSSMSRYPVLTALGNLAQLTIDAPEGSTAYVLTRTERIAENNDLVYDADGRIVYDMSVTRNGEACSFEAFEAAYDRLITVSVSGVLPEDSVVDEAPHTVYTFTDVDGTVHTVALHTCGVLHDAVSVDGHLAFYLVKGEFKLDMP